MLYINQETQIITSYKNLHVKLNPVLLLHIKSALRQKLSIWQYAGLSDSVNAIYKLQSCETVFVQQPFLLLVKSQWLVTSSSLKSS